MNVGYIDAPTYIHGKKESGKDQSEGDHEEDDNPP